MNLKKTLSLILAACAMAMLSTGCAPAEAGAGAGGNSAYSIVMLVVIFGLFYFMMIRPENKRRKKATEMRDSTEVGDNITTIGGIVGKVVHVTEDKITFETGEDRVRIEAMKWCISENRGKGSNKDKGDSEEMLKS